MKPIPISSCPNCDPETWIIEGESKNWYKCVNCNKLISKILRGKNYERSNGK